MCPFDIHNTACTCIYIIYAYLYLTTYEKTTQSLCIIVYVPIYTYI